MSVGYPIPMFIEGSCICNDTICPNVAFTFNLSLNNGTEDVHVNTSAYWDDWRGTQWWYGHARLSSKDINTNANDKHVAYSADPMYLLDSSKTAAEDSLVVKLISTIETKKFMASINGKGDTDLSVDQFITFRSNVPKRLRYKASSTSIIPYQECAEWDDDSAIGFGSAWSNAHRSQYQEDNDITETCTKSVSHRVRAIRTEDDVIEHVPLKKTIGKS